MSWTVFEYLNILLNYLDEMFDLESMYLELSYVFKWNLRYIWID